MVRTVSLWIRTNGKFSQPQRQQANAPEGARRGILLALCGKMVSGWQRSPDCVVMPKRAKEKLLRDVERGTVPASEALPHLNPPT
jgi:hypothetical protein